MYIRVMYSSPQVRNELSFKKKDILKKKKILFCILKYFYNLKHPSSESSG